MKPLSKKMYALFALVFMLVAAGTGYAYYYEYNNQDSGSIEKMPILNEADLHE